MLKSEDIINLAKDCKLEANVDFGFENAKTSIYHLYALLLELKDRYELFDYFYLINQPLPPMLDNDRNQNILEELLKNDVIVGF